MRVLHVTPYFAPAFNYGGPPRSILGLCQAQLRAGIHVDVFTTTANGDTDLPACFDKEIEYEGVGVRYFPRAFPRQMFAPVGFGEVVQSVISRYDLLHVHGLWNLPAWLAAQPARRGGLPYVISPRGMLEPGSLAHKSWKKRVAYLLAERRNLAKASLLHATSEAEGETLAAYGFRPRVVVLPNGVDFSEARTHSFGQYRRRLGLDESARVLVFLGRIHPIKRLDLVAAAFEKIRASVRNAHLIIAGPDEAGHRAAIEPLFASACDAVHWVGEVAKEDKWALLRDADALVMCSDSESFGLSIVEAMAAGTPVVVTRTCPWHEVERAGAGFWVAQEPTAIADAVTHLFQHPAEAAAMGDAGRSLVRANYEWNSIAARMIEEYAMVINAGGIRRAA